MKFHVIEKSGVRREADPDEALILPIVKRVELHTLLKEVEREEAAKLKKHAALEETALAALQFRRRE